MQRVKGVVQHYAWGDPLFIPRLLGVEPDGRPWAELWLGTHPVGPAHLADGTPLADVAGELPYLLKVLAAAQPLSLQTHPDEEQAREGHARGVFPDPHPKPELLCALTPVEALCGVRPVAETLELLDELGLAELRQVVAVHGPGAAFEALLRGRLDAAPIVTACRASGRREARWVTRLDELHPGDPSVAATLLLNLVRLRAGEALRLDAGTLHAYLVGAGIELMGASDNVVRAGLTSKAVDVDLLLRIADTEPLPDPKLPATARYELPAAGVALLRVDPGEEHAAHGHELAIDMNGQGWYAAPGETFVPQTETYVVTGSSAGS